MKNSLNKHKKVKDKNGTLLIHIFIKAKNNGNLKISINIFVEN